jgi:hypothetical protein
MRRHQNQQQQHHFHQVGNFKMENMDLLRINVATSLLLSGWVVAKVCLRG